MQQMPTIGQEVLLANHLGTFMVEEVNVEAKTASVRRLRTNAFIEDVEWGRIWPLDEKARRLIEELKAEIPIEHLRQMVEDHNDPR